MVTFSENFLGVRNYREAQKPRKLRVSDLGTLSLNSKNNQPSFIFKKKSLAKHGVLPQDILNLEVKP